MTMRSREGGQCLRAASGAQGGATARSGSSSSFITDTDLLLVSRPRHGPRSPPCFLSIAAGPIRSATYLVDGTCTGGEDEGGPQLKLRSRDEACAEREHRAPTHHKIAIVRMRIAREEKPRSPE